MATAELRARISADATPYISTLARVKRATVGLQGAAGSVMGALGVGFSAAGLVAAIKGVAAYGDEISDASKRTGIGVEALQRLKFAAKLSGMELGAIEAATRGMAKAMYGAKTGSGDAAQAFSALKLNAKELEALPIDQQFLAIVGALGKVEDQNKRAALAMKVFGKSGTAVLPMVADGVDGIKASIDRMNAAGGFLSAADVELAARFNDELDTTAAIVGGKFQQSILSTFPQMLEMLNRNQEAVQNLGLFFDGLAMTIKAAADSFMAMNKAGVGIFNFLDKITDELAAQFASVGIGKSGGYAQKLAIEKGYVNPDLNAPRAPTMEMGTNEIADILTKIYLKLPDKVL